MINQLGPPTGVRSAVYTLMALLVLYLGLHSTFRSLGQWPAPCAGMAELNYVDSATIMCSSRSSSSHDSK